MVVGVVRPRRSDKVLLQYDAPGGFGRGRGRVPDYGGHGLPASNFQRDVACVRPRPAGRPRGHVRVLHGHPPAADPRGRGCQRVVRVHLPKPEALLQVHAPGGDAGGGGGKDMGRVEGRKGADRGRGQGLGGGPGQGRRALVPVTQFAVFGKAGGARDVRRVVEEPDAEAADRRDMHGNDEQGHGRGGRREQLGHRDGGRGRAPLGPPGVVHPQADPAAQRSHPPRRDRPP